MTRKIIAEQVPPEYQDSEVLRALDNGEYDRLIIRGNRDFYGYGECTAGWELISFCKEWFGCADIEDEYCVQQLEWILEDYHLCGESEEQEKIKEVFELLTQDISRSVRVYEEDIYCKVLDLLVGGEWHYEVGRGSAQSEWNIFYYDYRVYDNGIEQLITGYWNEGTEWICWEEGDEDNNVGMYCYEWGDEDIKQEIMDAMGGDEVELRKFAGWSRTANYEVV